MTTKRSKRLLCLAAVSAILMTMQAGAFAASKSCNVSVKSAKVKASLGKKCIIGGSYTAKGSACNKPGNTGGNTSSGAPSTDADNYNPVSLNMQERAMISLVNEDRARYGLPALKADAELSRLARIKSADMRDNNYFAHTSPTLGSAAQMVRNAGYSFKSLGENIAHHSTVEKAQAAFLSSSGHRANIMSASYTNIGIGVVTDKNGFVYVTQLFARK